MKKCNFLNPDKYEFLTWFFLGIALTTISWLIAVVIPELKSFNDIVKNGTDSLAIITTVSIFAILTLCKITQTEKELTTKQIITYLKIFAFTLAVVLIIAILWKFFHKKEEGFVLISALAVLISALLASYSVMLNIENTNQNEEIKKVSEKKSNIMYLIQNLNDILSVLNRYKDIDIGALKINTHNTLLSILEKKLNKLDDKEIIKSLTDEESNLLVFIRLRLYESIGILYNYSQSIFVDTPQNFNENTKFIIEKLDLLIPLLAKSNNIPIQKMEKN